FLGEISYSIYLLHHVLLNAAMDHAPALAAIPPAVLVTLYLLSTIALAQLAWLMVERPARATILALGRVAPLRRSAPGDERPPRSIVAVPAAVLIAAAFVSVLLGAGAQSLTPEEARQARGAIEPRGVRFGEAFELVAVDLSAAGEWIAVDL